MNKRLDPPAEEKAILKTLPLGDDTERGMQRENAIENETRKWSDSSG